MIQEDLCNFHSRVFGSPAPKNLIQSVQRPHNEVACEDTSQVEDDDLGYYPDGVKRTLTDDQIAIFRHSEIYSILRERQVRKENLEAEGGEESESMISQPEQLVKATVSSDEAGEVRSDDEIKDPLSTIPETASQIVEDTQARKKRKFGDTDTGYGHGRKYASRSARGFVRELDSATAQEQVLDYGEEPSTVDGAKEVEVAATQVVEQERESRARPSEGKKIWWPVIEPT